MTTHKEQEWSKAALCRANSARHYARILANNNVSYRIFQYGNMIQIDVPRADLQRFEQALQEQRTVRPSAARRRPGIVSRPIYCLATILIGGITGAVVSAWVESWWTSLVPAIFALAGCFIGLAATRPR